MELSTGKRLLGIREMSKWTLDPTVGGSAGLFSDRLSPNLY